MSDTAELLFEVGDERLLTIGSVVERLRGEFPDISVSKLRYLEEQGLVTPRRTKSGYRLYSQDDFNRLVRVLSMQRDEYLPLKVIRRELERSPAAALPSARQGLRKTDLVGTGDVREYTAEEIMQLTGADISLLDELEDYELIRGPPGERRQAVRRDRRRHRGRGGAARACSVFAPRISASSRAPSTVRSDSIEQVLLPALRSNRPERRREGLDQLDDIVQAVSAGSPTPAHARRPPAHRRRDALKEPSRSTAQRQRRARTPKERLP